MKCNSIIFIIVCHRYGYRVKLPEEEEIIIKEILTGQGAAVNDYDLFMKLWAGDKYIDHFYRIIKNNKYKGSETDPVERLLSVKAFASPTYIATAFMVKCEDERQSEVDFRHVDPVRKSLTLARYSKFLSILYVQYSAEYLDISMVREGFNKCSIVN